MKKGTIKNRRKPEVILLLIGICARFMSVCIQCEWTFSSTEKRADWVLSMYIYNVCPNQMFK